MLRFLKPLSRSQLSALLAMDVDYEDDAPEDRTGGRRMKGRGGEDDDRYAGKACGPQNAC